MRLIIFITGSIFLTHTQAMSINWSSLGSSLEGAIQQAGGTLQSAGQQVANAASSINMETVGATLENTGQQAEAILENLGQQAGDTFENLGNNMVSSANSYADCVSEAGSDVNEIIKCTTG